MKFLACLARRGSMSAAKVAVITPNRTDRAHRVRTVRFLEGIILLGLVVGAGVFYLGVIDRHAFLFYFFVPTAVAGVVFGLRLGLMYASVSIVLVLLPLVLDGVSYLAGDGQQLSGMEAMVALWAAFLLVMAYVVGWVSEHGGNRVLLQGLGSDAISAVERERTRMGYDIHDGIAQTATAALMEVEVVAALTAEAAPEVQQEVARLRDTCAQSVREIRTMIGQLRPPQLGADEFPVTLTQLVEEFQDRTGIKTELAVEGDLSVHTDSMRICVYRVIQEALSNVEQHAAASRTRVGIRATKRNVFLTVVDDGVGFDTQRLASRSNDGHFGLAGMEERVSLLAGRCEVDSSPGQGTVVRAHIPGYRA